MPRGDYFQRKSQKKHAAENRRKPKLLKPIPIRSILCEGNEKCDYCQMIMGKNEYLIEVDPDHVKICMKCCNNPPYSITRNI